MFNKNMNIFCLRNKSMKRYEIFKGIKIIFCNINKLHVLTSIFAILIYVKYIKRPIEGYFDHFCTSFLCDKFFRRLVFY